MTPDRFQSESPFRAFLLRHKERQAALTAMKRNNIVVYGFDEAHGVKFVERTMREILFVITAMVRDGPMKITQLRELWSSNRSWSYGMCRERKCCLKFDALHPRYTHTGTCRHWTYLRRTQVSLTGFHGIGDYRLALALSTHMEVVWAMDPSRTQEERETSTWSSIRIRAFAPLDMCFEEWSADDSFNHPRLAFTRMTGLFPSVNLDNASNWDFGELRWKQEGYTSDAPAGLVNHNCWLFVTNLPLERFSGERPQLEWKKLGNLQNYVHRFTGIERAALYPLALLMATRTCGLKKRGKQEYDRIVSSPLFAYFKNQLDEDQFKVLRGLLLMTGIILNDGPFGCGKTTTLSACAVAFVLFFSGQRVAIVSETNVAIDEDLKRIVKRLDDPQLKAAATASGFPWLESEHILRFGEFSDDMEAYDEFSLKMKTNDLRSQLFRADMTRAQRWHARQKVEAMEVALLSRAKILIGTTTQFQRESVRALGIPVIDCDEAAQTSEAALMQTLTATTQVALLAGDRRQLPTFSNLPESQKTAFEDGHPHHNLDSLLHSIPAAYKARSQVCPIITVRSVYRSNPVITRFLQVFYDIDLVARRAHGEDYLWDLDFSRELGITRHRSNRVRWLGVQNEGGRDDQTYNMTEVAVVILLVLKIRAEVRKRDLPIKRVLVVTPYRNQRKRVKTELNRLRDLFAAYVDVRVKTTDSSQGSEADVVIVSFTRYETTGFLGGHPERTLVSLSRAKDYLFMLGKRQVFKDCEEWQRLTQKANDMGIVYEPVDWDERDANAFLDDGGRLRKIAR